MGATAGANLGPPCLKLALLGRPFLKLPLFGAYDIQPRGRNVPDHRKLAVLRTDSWPTVLLLPVLVWLVFCTSPIGRLTCGTDSPFEACQWAALAMYCSIYMSSVSMISWRKFDPACACMASRTRGHTKKLRWNNVKLQTHLKIYNSWYKYNICNS